MWTDLDDAVEHLCTPSAVRQISMMNADVFRQILIYQSIETGY
jgi:hypothetical protein